MAEEVAKLKATVEIDVNSAQQSANNLSKRLDELNKKFQDGEKLTAKEQTEVKRLTKALMDLENYSNKLNKTKEKSNGIWSTLATRITVAGLAVTGITKSIGALTSALFNASKEAIVFQKNMSLVNTVFRMSKDDINSYSKQVASLGTKLGKAPSELAMGLYELSQAGVEAKDGMNTLELATKASVAGFTNVSTAVTAGIGMMNAYGLSTNDLNSIYDLQFKIVERGILTYDELKEALGNVMSSAVQAKVPMNELGGQLAYLTKQGQNYSKASVALARAYEAIFSKSDMFKKLGINVADANGNLRSTTDIMGDLAVVMSKYSEEAQFDIMTQLGFSERADRAIIAMMGNVKGVREEIANVTNNVGSMTTAFEKAQDNISTQWNKLKSDVFERTSNAIIDNEKSIVAVIKVLGALASIIDFVAGNIKKAIDGTIKFFTFGTSKNFGEWIDNLENLGRLITGTKENLKDSEVIAFNTSKAFENFSSEAQQAFKKVSDSSYDMTKNVGTDMEQMLTFYKNFTKDLSVEVKKQVAVTAGLGAGKSYIEQMFAEASKSGKTLTKEQISAIYKKAGELAQTTYETVSGTIGINTGKSTTSDYKPKLREAPNLKTSDSENTKTKEEIKLDLLDIENWALEVTNDIEDSWKDLSNFVESDIDFEKELQKVIDYENFMKQAKESFDNIESPIEDINISPFDFQVGEDGKIKTVKSESEITKLNEKYKKYNDNLSASADLLGELSSVMGDDFIGTLADSINGINSIIGLVGKMQIPVSAGGVSGLVGGLGIATAVIGILSPIVSTWFGNSDENSKREEATNKFNEAVETFKKTVEDMNLSQRVSFANLKMPKNLSAGGISGGGTSGLLSGITGGGISWGAGNATIDTSGIKAQLTSAGYGDIAKQVDAIFGKFAKYTSYIDASDWFKKKSYISGYDTAGAMEEINRLIKEAYDLNLQKFKEALNLTADSFVGAIESAMKEGKTFSITDMVTDSFNKVYADLIGRAGGDILGSKITDIIMQQMATLGISKESFAGMTPQQIIDKINELMKNAPAELQKIFDELGISAEKVNEQFEKIGNRNMPSLLKIGVAEVLASNTYNNSNTVVVQNAYGTVDRGFINLTTKAYNSNIYSRTGN